MRPIALTFFVLTAAMLPSLVSAQCPVQEIELSVTSDGTLPGVTRTWIGNMVSPGDISECSYYCTTCPPDLCSSNPCPDPGSSWTWHYDGTNCNAFALEFNFYQELLGVGTAIGIVNIDPTKMQPGGRSDVHVVLSNCSRGPHNCLLRVNPEKSTQGPGISYGICTGTADCTIDPSCRLKGD